MRLAEALAVAALALAPAVARSAEASIVLRWKAVEGAAAYELEIGADPELRQPLLRERVTTPGYRWRELPDERRWWRVRGVDAGGRPGRWSEVKTIEAVLRPPELRHPADGAAVPAGTALELACAPSPLLEGFELELSRDPDFRATVERRQASVPRFVVDLPAGAYHWRVRGTRSDGRATRWSSVRRLRVTEVPVASVVPAVAPGPDAPAETLLPAPALDVAPAADPVADAGSDAEPAAADATGTALAAAAAPEGIPAGAAQTGEAATAPPAPAAPAGVAPATIASPPEPGLRRLRAGARLGWHTNFAGTSSLSPGVEADWPVPGYDRLAVSLRVAYYAASATVPPLPGVSTPVEASAHVVPLGAAAVYAFPRRLADLYAGAGIEAQLVHSAVAGEERIEAVPAGMLVAGAGRRLRAGELFLEAGWATGTLDGAVARLRTGGFRLALGFRGGR